MSRLGFTALAAGVALALGACSGGGSSASPTVTGGTTAASGPAAGPALALDAGFGKDGVARVALAASGHQRFMAVTTAPDGKTYAAGFVTLSGGDQAMAVARVDAKGGLDRSFGKDGIASVNVAIGGKAGELARSIVVQSTGKIVVAGPVEHDPAAAGDAAKDTEIGRAHV